MAGRGDPPEGTPEGFPGSDDEYRSVVFDESFVRAARIQEFSATERMGADARAVRRRRGRRPVSRQALALVLVIALAFGTAVYLGVRHPYKEPAPFPAAELAITLVPLAPAAGKDLASGPPERLFGLGPAAGYRTGAEGVTLPAARRTRTFSQSQVMQALTTAKEYLVASSVDPGVLLGRETRHVRRLLDPGQFGQFDRSVRDPADDGRHSATGWMVRFDPRRIALAGTEVRVDGSIGVREAPSGALLVVTDHTFVYAVRSAAARSGAAGTAPVLFTVRRELRMQFDRAGLRDTHVTLLQSAAEAGPQRCSADGAGFFQPVLAGGGEESRDGAGAGAHGADGGTDPHDRERPVMAACGVLSTGS